MTRMQNVALAAVALLLASAPAARASGLQGVWIGLDPASHAGLNAELVDPATVPATTLLDIGLSLRDARVGTIDHPLDALPATATPPQIINPGVGGRGDGVTFDVRFAGPSASFPSESVFSSEAALGQVVRKMVPITLNETLGGERLAVLTTVEQDLLPTQSLLLTFDINPNQPLTFSGGLGTVDSVGLSFFDVFAELSAQGPIDPAQPLFTVTLTSVPEPAGVTLAGLTLGSLALCAGRQLGRQR